MQVGHIPLNSLPKIIFGAALSEDRCCPSGAYTSQRASGGLLQSTLFEAQVEQMGRIPLNGLRAVFYKALSQQLAQKRVLSKWGVYRLIRVLRLLNPPLKFSVAPNGAKTHVAKLGRIPMIPLLKTTHSISQVFCWSSSHKGACCQSLSLIHI